MKRVRVVLRHAAGETSQDYNILLVMSEDNFYEVSVYSCCTDQGIPTLILRKDGFTSKYEAENWAKRELYHQMVNYCLSDLDWEFT